MSNLKEKMVDFMLEGDYKKDALARISAQQERAIIKANEKAEKKKIKLEEKEERKKQRQEENYSFKSKFFFMNEEENSNNAVFYDADENQYFPVLIEKAVLLDEKLNPFGEVKGQTLLKRNLKTSPMSVEEDGNILKVTSIMEVVPEEETMDKAYIMLETKYQDFVIEFNVQRSF